MREKLKSEAMEIVETLKRDDLYCHPHEYDMADLISRQDAYIDMLQDTLKKKEYEAKRWREIAIERNNLKNDMMISSELGELTTTGNQVDTA